MNVALDLLWSLVAAAAGALLAWGAALVLHHAGSGHVLIGEPRPAPRGEGPGVPAGRASVREGTS